ncbi:MAG: hypothetical protein P4L56_12075 [Candidatus Sulfopaludibacter sp.]|nr:hypothetical protein [Candidatus Sulfopaludibacter sp.]
MDKSGNRLGYVEIVTDVHAQNELGDLHSKVAASLEEMTSTMTEVEAQTKSHANNGTDASKLANATRHTIGGQVAQSLAGIDEKAQQVDGIVEQIARASSEQSQALSALTQAISDLSSTALKSAGGQTADLVHISRR